MCIIVVILEAFSVRAVFVANMAGEPLGVVDVLNLDVINHPILFLRTKKFVALKFANSILWTNIIFHLL